jgi:hypothetical protein
VSVVASWQCLRVNDNIVALFRDPVADEAALIGSHGTPDKLSDNFRGCCVMLFCKHEQIGLLVFIKSDNKMVLHL